MCAKLLIVEEGLQGLEVGHWFEHIRIIANTCRSAGNEVSIAAYHKASPRLIAELQASPVLYANSWTTTRKSPWRLARFAKVFANNVSLYRSVRKLLLANHSQPYDVIFAPTVTMNHLLAWLWLTNQYGGKAFRRCVLFFLNMPGCYDEADGALRFPRSANLMRTTLSRFKRHLKTGKVRMAVETVRAREHMNQFCGIHCDVAPQPASLTKIQRVVGYNAKPVFGCYGFARHEKGSDLLQAALLQLLKENERLPAHFIIQWRNDFVDDNGRTICRHPVLLDQPEVQFIDRAFDTAEYTQYLSRTDAILLPYRRSSYVDRDSRVAIEAAILGIPTLYTKQTWLELCSQYCGAGVGVQDGDIFDLVRGIRLLVSHLDEYQKEAERRVATARAYFAPERFCDWLLRPDRSAGELPEWVLF